MGNKLLDAMKGEASHVLTENGGLSYDSTLDAVMDFFALGSAYRSRSNADKILLFQKAFNEDPDLAMKCLFYVRDIRGGTGEREFFRVVTKWLAINHTDVMRKNMPYISEYGRWDDYYALVGTPLEKEMFLLLQRQANMDWSCKTPSLLAKWLPSETTSSKKTRNLARKTADAFHMTARQYRKMLSTLRERIKVLEVLMSENRWDEIVFDKIPSKAGLRYKNAFARRDVLKAKYEAFMKDKSTKVNASALYPCDVVVQARKAYRKDLDDPTRLAINKYWDNLSDYFHNAVFNGVAVVDTSGSMTWGYGNSVQPIDVAISLGMYCGEKCNPASPWYGNYITFSQEARLVPIEGVDFVDKVRRIEEKNLCENTNIRSVFDLILRLAIENHVAQEDMPQNIVVISDMEFDHCASFSGERGLYYADTSNYQSEMEAIMREWKECGYDAPNLVFWNCAARSDQVPMRDSGSITFVSGYSPVLFESLLSGKTGLDLVLDKLNSERYAAITA